MESSKSPGVCGALKRANKHRVKRSNSPATGRLNHGPCIRIPGPDRLTWPILERNRRSLELYQELCSLELYQRDACEGIYPLE